MKPVTQPDQNARYFNKTADAYSEKELKDFDAFIANPLYDQVVAECIARTGHPPHVLDIGAGVGISSLPLLARGCRVTAIDVAKAALARLSNRAGESDQRLTTIEVEGEHFVEQCAADGTQFDIVLCRAMLHHVPDYVSFLEKVCQIVSPGGAFVSIADPLRYDSISRFEYGYARATYYSMRIFKGNYVRGLKTLLRRSRGELRQDLPEDTVEYHVVRNGVDQDAIQAMFTAHGFTCSIKSYFGWNNPILSPLGRLLGIRSSFACLAKRSLDLSAKP